MAKLKPIKDEKEMAAVPTDQPILVELEPPASGEQRDEPEPQRPERDDRQGESGEERLRRELEASKEATRAEAARASAAEAEADRLRTSHTDTEKELLTNSLASAQADVASAKAAYKRAFESGDADAMADAQEKMGRATAKVVDFEGAVAQFDEDAKAKPERVEPQVSIEVAIDRDPNLLPKEREWLKAHTEVLTDAATNAELSVGYNRALKAGLKRGTDAYFQYLDKFLGFAEPERTGEDDNEPDNERASIVSAPVNRESRSSFSGRPSTPTRITLSPEQRELARSMGLTDVQYARGKLQLDANKKSDPERFAGR